jgi:hypothetical protein
MKILLLFNGEAPSSTLVEKLATHVAIENKTYPKEKIKKKKIYLNSSFTPPFFLEP